MALPSCNCVAGLYPNWKKLGPIVAAARTWAGEAPNLHCYDNRPIQDQLNALYCAVYAVAGGAVPVPPPATLIASFYIPEIVDTFERAIAAGYTGNGDPDTFQREAAVDVLRSAHYQSGIAGQLVILEDDPTIWEGVAGSTPAVVPGELKFSASWVNPAVMVSVASMEYRIDADAPVGFATGTTLTDIAASAGSHTLGIRTVSTSGLFGAWATSASFEVTAPVNQEYVTGFTPYSDQVPVDARGIGLTVGASDIEITQLALWGDTDQYSPTITLHIRDAAGTSLGSVAVNTPAGSGIADAYNWGVLGTPVVVPSGTTIFIMTAALAFNGIKFATGTTTTIDATYDGPAYGQPPTLDTPPGDIYGPVNFRYNLV